VREFTCAKIKAWIFIFSHFVHGNFNWKKIDKSCNHEARTQSGAVADVIAKAVNFKIKYQSTKFALLVSKVCRQQGAHVLHSVRIFGGHQIEMNQNPAKTFEQ
jgi:hypothetical protein